MALHMQYRHVFALSVCSENLVGIAGHGTSQVRLLHISSNIQSKKIIRYLYIADIQAVLTIFLENISDWKRGQITSLKQPGLMIAISNHVYRLPFYCKAFIPP